jgi:hypothetical protein
MTSSPSSTSTALAYAQEMGNRPQTLYGIADSPVGLAAWILDHDIRSYELIARVFDGKSEGLTRDDILDNITHYWLTNTGVSSSRLYWENKRPFFAPKGVAIPVAKGGQFATAAAPFRIGSHGLQTTAQIVSRGCGPPPAQSGIRRLA